MGDELAVSRTVVREALKMLTAKGMVVTGPRVGRRVRPRSAWNHFDPDIVNWRLEAGVDAAFVRDLMELRLALEPAFSALLRVSFRLSVRNPAGARASLRAHRRLLDAVIARKPDAAEAMTFALIEMARADIESRIGSDPLRAADVHA